MPKSIHYYQTIKWLRKNFPSPNGKRVIIANSNPRNGYRGLTTFYKNLTKIEVQNRLADEMAEIVLLHEWSHIINKADPFNPRYKPHGASFWKAHTKIMRKYFKEVLKAD